MTAVLGGCEVHVYGMGCLTRSLLHLLSLFFCLLHS